jgi:CheY-like chemotaxis protein
VCLTGRSELSDLQRCKAAGFDASIPKPIE